MIKVTVFNEYWHEVFEESIREVYPKGIHQVIADFLGTEEDFTVRTITQFNEAQEQISDCGITEELLNDTDVLIWWAHLRHRLVPDEIVQMVADAVHCGMGIIFLHSAHFSKPFKKLMGTSGCLSWRSGASKERLWNICPSHPIMQGIDECFDLEQEEMYGERFDIPTPDEILMLGTYNTHEVFRSACTWRRGHGNVFYFQPGHESYPIYYNKNIQTIIKNAVRWVAPVYRVKEVPCPETTPIAF